MGMEVDDPFVGFIDYAISVLSPPDPDEDEDEDANKPPWSWAWGRIIKTCRAYSSGVTPAILLSELSQAWAENQRGGGYYYSQKKKKKKRPDQLQKNRVKLPDTVTIDTIYDKNFLSFTTLLQVVILDVFLLPGTNFYMLTLGDFWSSNTIDLYLHRRFYDLADLKNGILKKGRELLLTGCYLRPTTRGSGRHLRLLPTEYLLLILDEDEDDDAMLLAAQFCSDSLASVSVDEGVSYSLYARIESIGSLEIQGSLQKKQITLVDNDNFRIKFLLWGDQVVLANCFSVGSWLALDQPFVSSCMESEEIYLEYGSVTQLYIVPFIRHEEQVSVASTQGSKKLTTTADSSQGPKVSQVTLPCDSRGAIDFSNYPFRLFVADLRDKMSNISIYGVVTCIKKPNIPESSSTFSLRVEDPTGGIWANLHFVKSWSLGKISIGHTVYIAGLTCAAITKCQSIEVSWDEKDGGCLFVNLSCLPALLNSSCLHKASTLSDLSANTHVCRIWLDQIEHCDVSLRYFHTSCGHIATQNSGFECNFCGCDCNDDIVPGFHLKVTIADNTGKVLAWCTGHTATELLQISPDEFFNLPEEEQMMYPSSLEHERFIVALVNSKQGTVVEEDDVSIWEITQALKSD